MFKRFLVGFLLVFAAAFAPSFGALATAPSTQPSIPLAVYDIVARKTAQPIVGGGTLDSTAIPALATIEAFPASPTASMRFQLFLPGGNTINHLEGSAPWSLNGDGVPVAFPVGSYSLTVSEYATKNGNTSPVQSQTTVFSIAVPVRCPIKGVDDFTLANVGPNFATLANQLNIQSTRMWCGQADAMKSPTVISADVINTTKWFIANRPGYPCVWTFARGNDGGKNCMTTPTPAAIAAEAKSIDAQVKSLGYANVIVNLGNEPANRDWNRYWNPQTPVPAGMTQAQWYMRTYLDRVQNPLRDALMQLSGGQIQLAGFSFTDPDDAKWAVVNGYTGVKFADGHVYARAFRDFATAYGEYLSYLPAGMKLIATEYGGPNGPNGVSALHQSQIVGQGYATGMAGLYEAFYYKVPTTPGMQNDSGFLNAGKPIDPIATTIKNLPAK